MADNLEMLILPGAVFVLLCAACAAILWRVASSAGPQVYATMLLLRACGLTALSLLLWKSFWRPEELTADPSPQAARDEVIVLQDKSASMELRGSSRRARDDLAETIWAKVEERSRESDRGSGRRVRRYLFAENLVKAGSGRELFRDGTRLSKAFVELLSREAPSSLLIISDGISTDGLAPPYLVDWARNRNTRILAICCADEETLLFDRAIREVECESRNPMTVTVTVRSAGKRETPVEVSLGIDGASVAQARRSPEPAQDVVFRLPELEPGWHAYNVEVRPLEGEATEENNRHFGTFRTGPRADILLVHDKPRIENVHLARFLRNKFREKAVFAPAARLGDPGRARHSPSVIVLADVDPERIPERVRREWSSGAARFLVLGGPNLGRWASREIPRFPLIAARTAKFLGEAGGKLTLSPAAAARTAFGETELDLRLELLQPVTVREDAKVFCGVESDGKIEPLLVVDSLEKPRCAALLADTTWKWAMRDGDEVRREYERFWAACLDWLVRSDARGPSLILELEPREDGEDEIRGWVAPGPACADVRLDNLRVAAQGDRQTISVETAAEGARHSFRFRRDRRALTSGVLWFQAFAEVDGRQVSSERVPAAFNQSLEELRRIQADGELLRRYTTGDPGGFAWYAGRASVIDSLFETTSDPAPQRRLLERKTSLEILLAFLAVLFLGLEWWLERRIFAGEKP